MTTTLFGMPKGEVIIIFAGYNFHMKTDFASRLRELRTEKELSYEKISKATGLSGTAIYHWEIRKYHPILPNVIALAKFFNVSLDYIAGLKDD